MSTSVTVVLLACAGSGATSLFLIQMQLREIARLLRRRL